MRALKFRRALFINGVFSHFKYWGKDIDRAVFVTPGPGTGYDVKDDQQFSGLLDKNGKEIYEGDIDKDGGVIVWVQDIAQFCIDYPGVEIQELKDAGLWMEVIGNIYEHPELLKGREEK